MKTSALNINIAELVCDGLGSSSGYVTLGEGARYQYESALTKFKPIPKIWARWKMKKAVEITGVNVSRVCRGSSSSEMVAEVSWTKLEIVGGILGKMIVAGSAVMGIDDIWKNVEKK